ncbi:MAG TPA: cytochrome c [Acidimicrobiales bacterium]|nr:cytochrome c [Acidimicrobiales bacterium]
MAVAVALLVAACGGDGDDDAGSLPPEASRGRELVEASGCSTCHSTDGSDSTGPTWQGLAGAEVTLDDGTTVVADSEYLARSIREPRAEVVDGFSPVMPTFDFSEDEVAAIVAYIETLAD